MTDEEYVRARWKRVAVAGPFFDSDAIYITLLDQFHLIKQVSGTPTKAWSAVRTFTEQREREIAEVEEEIDCLKIFGPGEDWMDVHQLVVFARILAVEQARLAELRRGWKEGSE